MIVTVIVTLTVLTILIESSLARLGFESKMSDQLFMQTMYGRTDGHSSEARGQLCMSTVDFSSPFVTTVIKILSLKTRSIVVVVDDDVVVLSS